MSKLLYMIEPYGGMYSEFKECTLSQIKSLIKNGNQVLILDETGNDKKSNIAPEFIEKACKVIDKAYKKRGYGPHDCTCGKVCTKKV